MRGRSPSPSSWILRTMIRDVSLFPVDHSRVRTNPKFCKSPSISSNFCLRPPKLLVLVRSPSSLVLMDTTDMLSRGIGEEELDDMTLDLGEESSLVSVRLHLLISGAGTLLRSI